MFSEKNPRNIYNPMATDTVNLRHLPHTGTRDLKNVWFQIEAKKILYDPRTSSYITELKIA